MKKWASDILFVLVVAGIVGGWIALYPSSSESVLSPLAPPAGLGATEDVLTYASPEGLALAYRLCAPEDEPEHVLILLHDTPLHSGWYAGLGAALAERGIAVYLPDRRGHGHSEGDWREVAKDRSVLTGDIAAMISVARARYPQAEIVLGGHGRGAGLVLGYLATERPLAGAVLIEPYISDDQPDIQWEGWKAWVQAHPGEAFLARSGMTDWPVWHYNWPAAMVKADPSLETDSAITWEQETVPLDPVAGYQREIPILYLRGTADPLFDLERTPLALAKFATSELDVQLLTDADYLTIVDAAADPVAHWLNGR
jgi:alpha-beta hydrolase superfamily lysophospholipase